MAVLSNDDIAYAVQKRARQDAEYDDRLRRAVRRRDEDEIGKLIRKAVKKILGVVVDVTFDIIRLIMKWF